MVIFILTPTWRADLENRWRERALSSSNIIPDEITDSSYANCWHENRQSGTGKFGQRERNEEKRKRTRKKNEFTRKSIWHRPCEICMLMRQRSGLSPSDTRPDEVSIYSWQLSFLFSGYIIYTEYKGLRPEVKNEKTDVQAQLLLETRNIYTYLYTYSYYLSFRSQEIFTTKLLCDVIYIKFSVNRYINYRSSMIQHWLYIKA